MDREKVIKGLEHCRKTACESCPYNATDAKNTNPICLINEMLSDALELLKEQEAVSITTDYFDGFGNKTSHCPSCNSRLVWHQNKNYCGECGKAVKWE